VSAISFPEPESARGPALTPPLDRTSDTSATPLRLFGLEFSLETASLDALERVTRTISRERLRGWFSRLEGTQEVGRIATCHRVELLFLLGSLDELERWRELLPGDRDSWRLWEGRALVRHIFRVAAGRESLARGEGEVRHQVRAAGGQIDTRHPRPVLRELFGGAAEAADEVRPSVPRSQSIAAVASNRLLALLDRALPRVLVIGSGVVGRQVAESLSGAARVTMLFHRNPPDPEFLRQTGTRAESLDRLSEELSRTEAVVTAAKFGDRGLRASDLPQDHSLLLFDLGMPRNIDPDVRELPNVRLVDLENLYASRVEPTDGLDLRLEELAAGCSDRLEFLLLEPWVTALRRGAEEIRCSELQHARRFLGKLSPEQERAVDRLTQRIVARLLLPPTERLRSLPPGSEGDLQRRLAIELFRPLPRDP
jgi:glutamyl-tRNA reductase